ncbi:MAG: hypothetical protein HN738_11715, partial [Gammaproteobacteria bacterium]|nr:hypothetical protein [Gammaproteobacteria bacterium]
MNNQLLWSGKELQTAFAKADIATGVNGISIDSRTTMPGDLFVALCGNPGPRFGGGSETAGDGHNFIEMATTAGASVVMAHREVTCSVPVL